MAKDFTGYQNLVTLVTAAHLEGYYYRPRMDKVLVEVTKPLDTPIIGVDLMHDEPIFLGAEIAPVTRAM